MQDHTAVRSDRSAIAYLAFLGVLLATGVDIALPAFDAIEEGIEGATNVSLVITMYFVGMALGQLVYGPLGDRYGRRPAILSGLVLYAIGAVASALAPTFGVLILARLLWGLGAAAPAGLRSAITRDLYQGDKMARVNTIMMAVFLLGPVFMPLIGELFIRIAPWQIVFWFSAVVGLVGIAWCLQFGETLDPAQQRPIQLGELGRGLRAIVQTRATLGHMLANVFYSAAFFIFLGSVQPVFDQVYDRSHLFAVMFALFGVITIVPLLINNRLIGRYGARRMSVVISALAVVGSAVGLALTLAADGRPAFLVWYIWLVVVSGLLTLVTPMLTALALDPMGDLAGTASALMYFTSFAAGALLAAIFDSLVETTVTPFVVGFGLYTAIGFLILLWAGGPAER